MLYKCNNGAVMGLAGLSMRLSGAIVGIRGQPKKRATFSNYFKKVTLYFYRHKLIKQLNEIYILIHFTKMHNTFHLFQYINTQVFLY